MAKCQRPRRVKPSYHRWAESNSPSPIQASARRPSLGSQSCKDFNKDVGPLGFVIRRLASRCFKHRRRLKAHRLQWLQAVLSGSFQFHSHPFTSIHLFVESIGDLFFRLRLHQIYVVRIHVHSARSNYFEHLWTTPCPIQSTSSPVDGRTGWKHKTWRAAVVAWHLWRTLSLQPLDMFGASSWSHGSWVIPWLTRNASLSSWVVLAKRCLLPMYAYAILRISRCLTFFVNKSLNNCCRRGVWQLRLRWTRCCSQWTIMENRSCKSDSQRQLHESRRTNSIPLGRRGTHSLVFC